MTVCQCGHPQDRHNDKPHFVYGCSYEFDPKVERGRWLGSDYGICECLTFEPLPEPGKPIVFGVHRIPAEAKAWVTESEEARDARFAKWVAGAPKDMT